MNQPFQIVAMGEILWDIFPDRTCFGGAPANFACAMAELGQESVDVQMFSGVGHDELGNKAIEQLTGHGVKSALVQRLDQNTGEVRISLNQDGSANYEFADDVAWDNLKWSDKLVPYADSADAICFGTLGQRCPKSANTIQQFVRHARPNCLKVLDINLRFPHVVNGTIERGLKLCNVLKLNEEELPYVAQLMNIGGSEIEILEQLEKRFDIKLIALTQGSSGTKLKCGENFADVRPNSVHVVDTVGAGDAFTATLTLGLLQCGKQKLSDFGKMESSGELKNLAVFANKVAGYVCSQPGATPTFPDEFRTHMRTI